MSNGRSLNRSAHLRAIPCARQATAATAGRSTRAAEQPGIKFSSSYLLPRTAKRAEACGMRVCRHSPCSLICPHNERAPQRRAQQPNQAFRPLLRTCGPRLTSAQPWRRLPADKHVNRQLFNVCKGLWPRKRALQTGPCRNNATAAAQATLLCACNCALYKRRASTSLTITGLWATCTSAHCSTGPTASCSGPPAPELLARRPNPAPQWSIMLSEHWVG